MVSPRPRGDVTVFGREPTFRMVTAEDSNDLVFWPSHLTAWYWPRWGISWA